MNEEILMNISPMETRVTVIENGLLLDLHIERNHRRGIVGNIYKAKVVRIMPGMQAAFVEIGLEKAGFIHVDNILRVDHEGMEIYVENEHQITELLREGQSLIVQVEKDPIGSKGPRLTTHLSIPSRYLVYMPRTRHVGISQRIEDEEERDRLKNLVTECMVREGLEEQGGFIIRTAAENASEKEITEDIRFLSRLWKVIDTRMREASTPALIYSDLPLSLRAMRDLVRDQVERIRIDTMDVYNKVRQFAEDFMPEMAGKVEYYSGDNPIFELHNIEDEIQKALSRTVKLKSGGELVFDQTEAMTTIDVNTAAFVGKVSHEETVFKTNLEAATSISRQLRLRNIGGIIIIDFIDMKDPEHRRQVLRTLSKIQQRDHAKVKISEISGLGLVEMTRKRNRESLRQVLCEPCPVCYSKGFVRSSETICYEIFREILRDAKAYEHNGYLVMASQSVVDLMLDEESDHVADLEKLINKTIKFQVETLYSQEQFDVVLL